MKSLVGGAALRFAPYIFDKDHFHPDDLISAPLVRWLRQPGEGWNKTEIF